MDIGDRIRQIRKDKGMSQDTLSKLTGIPRMTIVRIENSQQKPRLDKLTPIAKALECDVEDFNEDGGVSRWVAVLDPDGTLKGYFVCAKCGLLTNRRSKYCPNCGKKMM